MRFGEKCGGGLPHMDHSLGGDLTQKMSDTTTQRHNDARSRRKLRARRMRAEVPLKLGSYAPGAGGLCRGPRRCQGEITGAAGQWLPRRLGVKPIY
jgi:hypothetical protein